MNTGRIRQLLTQFIIDRSISYGSFRERVHVLYHIQFFFTLKSDIFVNHHVDELSLLLKDQYQFSNFLGQCRQLIEIALETLSSIMLGNTRYSTRQKKALEELDREISEALRLLKELSDFQTTETEKNKDADRQSVVYSVHLLSKLYFSIVSFLRTFYESNLD
jgi:hypothetical protein